MKNKDCNLLIDEDIVIKKISVIRINIILAMTILIFTYLMIMKVLHRHPLGNHYFIILICLAIISLILGIVSLFTKFLACHQFFDTMILLYNVISLFVFFMIVAYSFIIYDKHHYNLTSYYAYYFMPLIILLTVCTIIYHIIRLYYQLKYNVSQQYTVSLPQYYEALLFVSVIALLIISKLSHFYLIILVYLISIGLVIIFTKLIVELSFVAYLKYQDKTYWEQYPNKINRYQQYKLLSSIIFFSSLALTIIVRHPTMLNKIFLAALIISSSVIILVRISKVVKVMIDISKSKK